MKQLLKAALAKSPYRLTRRSQGNRFMAVEDALVSLKTRGFAPRTVIDCGANVGHFSDFALCQFPDAVVHAIEPQPGCQAALHRLQAKSLGRLTVHATALGNSEQEGATLTLSTDANASSTGAHVSVGDDCNARNVTVPCRSLDDLLAGALEPDDRALLKLDLQGYELHALHGATQTLQSCEVVLTEVSFYAQSYEPPISVLVAILAQYGFELYDIAAVYARPRDDRPRQGDFIFARRGSLIVADTRWS
jgi:FkbM family methyltransferase